MYSHGMKKIVKILNISTSDLNGGAARAAYRIHKSLLEYDVNVEMLVQRKISNDSSVHVQKGKTTKLISLIRPNLEKIPIQLYKKRSTDIFSTGLLPHNLLKEIMAIKPDLVHLHWVNSGFLSIKTISAIEQPIVWTLHDMWPFTGGCHYSDYCNKYKERCYECPKLGSKSNNDLSTYIFRKKIKLFNNKNITIVTPSKWLQNCAQESMLFRNKNIIRIPYPIDLNIFKPLDTKIARELFNIPQNKKVVLFGALGSTKDPRKGYKYLKSALNILEKSPGADNLYFVVFGGQNDSENEGHRNNIQYIDTLYDEYSLAMLYSAADIFVAPSREDNLPQTVLESLACGTPVVAFNIGGMPDMIEHKFTGFLAKPFSEHDISSGILWLLSDNERLNEIKKNSRRKVCNEYSPNIIANEYINLYKQVLCI